jgi:hypothetical protein
MVTKKNTAKQPATKTFGNKTKFVLGLSSDLSAKHVVDEARKNGLAIAESHVHNIRSVAKSKERKGIGAQKGSRARGVVGAAPPRGRYANHEARLIEAALHVGLARAAGLLDRIRAHVKNGL